MFSIRLPTPPQNPISLSAYQPISLSAYQPISLSGDDPTATSMQARPPSQVVPEPLPTSVSVGDLTFHTGGVMTALSELEKRILCVAFHSETPKEPLGDLNENNHIFPYAFGPNHYFSPLHCRGI